MIADYSKYQASDFLVDDYFIDTMLNPTCESEEFWKFLLDEKIINVDEFISAYMILKRLHENKPEVDAERLDIILNRIISTNNTRNIQKKYINVFKYVAAACCLIGIVGFSYFEYLNKNDDNYRQSITDFAQENIIHTQQPDNEIQIVTGNRTFAVKGTQAKVEYDSIGLLNVNKQKISINKSNSEKGSPVYNQLRVPYGKRAYLTLSDGTSLWVNTGSTVIYPTVFEKNKREIYIEGEVFAEVSHDKNRPFIVKTDKIDVQVLGTVFNLSAYKEDLHTDVVLVTGSVNVKPKNGKPTMIKPNQLYKYTKQATTLTTVDVEGYISWHDGIYIFHNEPIENILLRLSRYYNVTMKLPSNASGISCSGKLELKDNLDQLLEGLSEIASMNFAVKDNEYQIKFN